MNAFLRFTLYGPLVSWGEIAVGENRSSWDRPSRSAILGFLGAALGVTRDAGAELAALDRSFGLAVRVDLAGLPLLDYHTVQSAAESELRKTYGRRRPSTRRQLLSVAERQTIVSRRELRQDALATVALWSVSRASPWDLSALRAALRRPVFTLYAGRKSNVLALPLGPEIIESATLADAFAFPEKPLAGFERSLLKPRGHGWGREVSHDPLPEGMASGLTPVRSERRRDAEPNRGTWQFADRIVEVGLLPEGLST